jgi:DNA-binding LacI/PurR family transcriptional regulator
MKLNEKSKIPYYTQVKELLKDKIVREEINLNTRFPTMREIASLFNVSLVTACKAIQELKNEGLLYSRPRKGIRLADNISAILSSQQSTPIIGVTFADRFQRQYSYYFNELFDGIAEAAKNLHFDIQMFPLPPENDATQGLCEHLKRKKIAGLILASRVPVQTIVDLMDHKMPFVWINNDLPYEKIHVVTIDTHKAIIVALNYLKQCGYRRVGLVNFWWKPETQAAYQDMLQDKGLDTDPDLIKSGSVRTLEEEQQMAGIKVKELLALPEPPEVLFLYGEGTLTGAYQVLQKMKLHVPRDIGIIGCIQKTFADHFPLPLTYVLYPNQGMAVKAAQMLWDLVRKRPVSPEKIFLSPELVIGATCRKKEETLNRL